MNTRNSGRVQDDEQVVTKEKKPVGHRSIEELDNVEQVARDFNE